ncbi:MAG: nucleotidyl transferase AbiEii/AbiGii toxin family protein [Rickettsiales bacterium]|jgi:predicted nucleotidyltransferase component of viral defense system|nr:nucleotidyl transferase AbiEii/AbiGii toxin family protein [Rickettsiales bacterium]
MVKISVESYKTLKQSKMPRLAEKDLLECLILDRLFANQYIAENFVFSGGSSISKSHGLIRRFNEDIDLACSDFDDIPKRRPQNQLTKFKKNFKKFVFDVIKPKINHLINQDQQFMIATDQDWKALSNTECFTYPMLHLFYKSEFSEDMGHLYIEIIPRKYDDSLVSCKQVIPYSTKEKIGNIPTVSCEQTFWDKIHAIHSNAKTEKPNCEHLFSRHYYDVAKLSETTDLDKSKKLLFNIVKYQQTYTTRKIEWLESFKNINLIPNDSVLEKLEDDYKKLQKTFLEPPESWAGIIQTLRHLNQNLKLL